MVNNLFAGKDSMYFLYRRLVTKMKKDGLEDVMDNMRPDENEESVRVESPKIPWGMILFALAGWFFTLFMLGRINRSGLSIPELMERAPVMVILLAVGIVLMLIGLIWFSSWKRKLGRERREAAAARGPVETKEYDRTWLSEAERLEVWDVVPETAVIMTFLQEEYDVVNGEKVHRDYKKTAYESHLTKVFVQDGKFCMDVGKDALAEIPLDAFGTARKQPRTTFHYWMQSKSVDSEEYQPYQIEKLGHGNFSCEYYYVPIKYEGREYSLLVPTYEIKPFQQLTGVGVDFQ